MTDYYFKFEFTSIHNTNKNMNYYVLAENMDDLKLFLLQHNFHDVPPEAVQVVPRDYNSGSHVLESYRFKSNSSSEIFSVMTCWLFIEETVQNLSMDLNQYMLFGEAIIRRDIEVFKVIGDLLSGMDHIHIIDYIAADIESTDTPETSAKEITEMRKEYCRKIGSPTEDTDMYITYESIFDAMDRHDGVLPITIECYIGNFTEMMMDAFE